MNAGKRRKLVKQATLAHMALMCTGLGVPLAKQLDRLKLTELISRPAASKLLKHYSELESLEGEQAAVIYNSLFPAWLADDLTGVEVVEQPLGWTYSGYFPLGQWSKVSK